MYVFHETINSKLRFYSNVIYMLYRGTQYNLLGKIEITRVCLILQNSTFLYPDLHYINLPLWEIFHISIISCIINIVDFN